MRDFFKGWHRKVGCIALVLASASLGIWIRGRVIQDYLAIGQYYYLFTTREGIGWQFAQLTEGVHFPNCIDWWTLPSQNSPLPVLPLEWRDINHQLSEDGNQFPIAGWHWQWIGFACAQAPMTERKYTHGESIWVLGKVSYVILPHWFCSISLTLLSAGLILWKARPARWARSFLFTLKRN